MIFVLLGNAVISQIIFFVSYSFVFIYQYFCRLEIQLVAHGKLLDQSNIRFLPGALADVDFLNDFVQPEAYGWIGHAILHGNFFQRTGDQNKVPYELHVFLIQARHPVGYKFNRQ